MKSRNPQTYTKGQTVHCDRSGVAYNGIRHRLHRNDATGDCNITIDIVAHKQEGIGWRLLCIEHDHNEGKTNANYIGEQYRILDDILSDATNIVEKTGYL
jgi:hypothetical protein